jgi:hypothetical protein
LHQLNRTAALVWQNCNGRRTIADLKKILQHKLDPAADEALVWNALDRLGKARLLRETVGPTASVTRRQALGKLGRAAAAALLAPVVTSIIAPGPAQGAPGGVTFPCNSNECLNSFCADICKSDYISGAPGSTMPCTVDKPFCRVQSCITDVNGFCPGCTQRRCTTNASLSATTANPF